MTRQWLGCTSMDSRELVRSVLAAVSPSGTLDFARDGADLRVRLRDEEPGDVGVIVGFCEGGVSDINLAAAIVADGLAQEVILVAREVTGSLRSRASCAGITRVIDVADLTSPVRAGGMAPMAGEGRLPMAAARTGGGEGTRPDAGRPLSARSPIVTIVSGRGGVGKSAIAAVTAVAAGRWGMRVALCDLDLASGNLHEYLGLRQGSDLARVVSNGHLNQQAVAAAGIACADNVTLWGPCARPEMAEAVAPVVGELLGVLSMRSDLVLVDTSTACTDAVAQAMQLADRLVVVHGPERLGLLSPARTSALAVRLGVARTRIVRVENGCAIRDLGQPFMPRAEVGLETARAFRVVDGGEDVGELLRAGEASALCDLDADFSQTALTFLAQLLEELGSMPDCEEAHRLAKGIRRRTGLALFGRRREAV